MAEAFGLTYVGNRFANPTPTTDPYTFTAVDVGADVTGADKRYTVIAVGSIISSGNLASVTIGGVSATLIGGVLASNTLCALAIADTSGLGTSLNVVIDHVGASSISSGAGIGVYRLVNPLSATPYASTSPTTHSSGVCTLSINVPSGGAALAATMVRNNSAHSISWSGVSEDFEVDVASDDRLAAGLTTTAGTPRTITATTTDTTPQGMVGASASWEAPAAAGGVPKHFMHYQRLRRAA